MDKSFEQASVPLIEKLDLHRRFLFEAGQQLLCVVSLALGLPIVILGSLRVQVRLSVPLPLF